MNPRPLVSVLVPARNEAADIERCLAAVMAQDYPADCMDVVVVDGDSADGTAALATRVLAGARFKTAAVITNATATTPSNLNAGLAAAAGEIVCRVDARSIIPPDYIRRCVEVLTERSDVVVTGGAQVAVARNESVIASGIARALNNRYGMGLSRYRRGAASGPADTVYLGAFRTQELRAAGGWDERFDTNQDFELNRRMAASGGVVWFDARLAVGYVPRATVAALYRQYRRFGQAKVRYWRTTGDRPQPRQVALLLGAPVTIVAGGVALAAAPRRLRWLTVPAAVAGAFAVEGKGTKTPDGNLVARAVSVVAMAAVATGWSVGAWGAAMSRPHPPS